MSEKAGKRERRTFRRWTLVLTASFITSSLVVMSTIAMLLQLRETFNLPHSDTTLGVGLVLMALVWFVSTSCVVLAADRIHRSIWTEHTDDGHE